MLNRPTFNSIVLSYKSISLVKLYFVVGMRANQRLYSLPYSGVGPSWW